MQSDDDLDATGMHRALALDEQQEEGSEGIHRTAAQLRDLLSIDDQKHLALVFEWAIEGIRSQILINRTPELEALHDAYATARDILVAELRTRS